MSDATKKNTSLWRIAAGLVVVFGLSFIYGPALVQKIQGSTASENQPRSQTAVNQTGTSATTATDQNDAALVATVLPASGATLPVTWDDLGKQLVESGAIDRDQLVALYRGRSGLDPNDQKMLDAEDNGQIVITSSNASFLLNLFWALGLGNKNPILENGPMVDPRYGGAGKFASTGGWTLAKGNAMDHYSQHDFITLSDDQQSLVERVAQGIFRPCCNNATYFPDCNHGMAMLGLLELMAAQNVSEDDMYAYALQVNAFWFSDTYLTLAKYMQVKKNVAWDKVDPRQMLSAEFSSAAGFRNIRSQVDPVQGGSGSGCSV